MNNIATYIYHTFTFTSDFWLFFKNFMFFSCFNKNNNFLFSPSVTLDILDQVVADHDVDVRQMQDRDEEMWDNCSSKRERKTKASKIAPGFSLYGDNIGITHIRLLTNSYIGHFITSL